MANGSVNFVLWSLEKFNCAGRRPLVGTVFCWVHAHRFPHYNCATKIPRVPNLCGAHTHRNTSVIVTLRGYSLDGHLHVSQH